MGLLRRYRAMKRALTLIAGDGCEAFTGPPFCPETHRTPDCPFLADRWCDACIARIGLGNLRADAKT